MRRMMWRVMCARPYEVGRKSVLRFLEDTAREWQENSEMMSFDPPLMLKWKPAAPRAPKPPAAAGAAAGAAGAAAGAYTRSHFRST